MTKIHFIHVWNCQRMNEGKKTSHRACWEEPWVWSDVHLYYLNHSSQKSDGLAQLPIHFMPQFLPHETGVPTSCCHYKDEAIQAPNIFYLAGSIGEQWLARWFSTSSTLRPFKTVPHVVGTVNYKVIFIVASWLSFSIVMGHNVNIFLETGLANRLWPAGWEPLCY